MNKTILGLALLTAATLLAIPGDFNGNGMLDVGDLGRLEYFASEHLYDPGADLNFDEVIDKSDILLLFEAVTKGKPLPVMLYRERIQRNQENTTISESGLTVDIPGTCYASPLLTFATIDPLPDFDVELGNAKISQPVILYNMPEKRY